VPDQPTGRADDDVSFRAFLHEQWLVRRNRRQEDPAYPDDWWAEQCGGCEFWLALAGPMGKDYGSCSNPESAFFGVVRFEHDGCEAFAPGGPWHDISGDIPAR
jgi:hypothetical protein